MRNSCLYILILSSYACNISKSFQEQQEKETTHPIEDIKNSQNNIRLTMDVQYVAGDNTQLKVYILAFTTDL